jgi:hypothetical protein
VIGGTGLIGSKVVALLRQRGQEVLAASPNSGVNTLTGEGLPKALAGAQVVIDLANSPSFEDAAVMKFFQTSGRNLFAAEAAAGTHPLFAACRHSAVRQRPRGCAEGEERQGDPRLPARTAERFRQEHQGRARRIWLGRSLAGPHAFQIRLHLRDR